MKNNRTNKSCKNISTSNTNNSCPKSGIKIHESDNDCTFGYNDEDQMNFYNKIKNQNKHTGVRIENSKNEYNIDPFDNINPFCNPDGEKTVVTLTYDKSEYKKLDLNINNYSQNELYQLFGIQSQFLSEDIMKTSKKTVLKTHPDKSGLEPKYFLFFSQAYKRLYSIYEFQNKSTKKTENKSEYYDSNNGVILDKMFEKDKSLKDTNNFNKWFNDQFDKHKLEDQTDSGYGDWLKSDEDIVDVGNVSQANMASEIEKRKKQVQALSKYNGVNIQYANTFGGSSLMDYNSNYTSGSMFTSDSISYTDLKQAYVESVIPVTSEDYDKMPKFRNIEEYKRYRETVDTKPLDKETSMKQLYTDNKLQEEESIALAYHYAKQAEKASKNNQNFWSSIKQIGNL
jgi:hypothetical protein